MKLASEILTTLYSLNTDELAIAIKNIQFLHDKGLIIGLKTNTMIYRNLKEYIKKKFL